MSTQKHITLGDLNAKSDVRGGAAKSTGKGKVTVANPVATGGKNKKGDSVTLPDADALPVEILKDGTTA